MLKRILLFSGLPVFSGLALFPFFYYLKVRWGRAEGMRDEAIDEPRPSCLWGWRAAAPGARRRATPLAAREARRMLGRMLGQMLGDCCFMQATRLCCALLIHRLRPLLEPCPPHCGR